MNMARQFSLLSLFFGLIGCAATGVQIEKSLPQDVVAKKALSRWDALIKGDLDAAYGYLSSGTRSVMSLEVYKAKIRPGMWKKVSVDSVVCVEDRCDVRVMLEYDYRDMKSITRPLDEIWLQENGEWWHVPQR